MLLPLQITSSRLITVKSLTKLRLHSFKVAASHVVPGLSLPSVTSDVPRQRIGTALTVHNTWILLNRFRDYTKHGLIDMHNARATHFTDFQALWQKCGSDLGVVLTTTYIRRSVSPPAPSVIEQSEHLLWPHQIRTTSYLSKPCIGNKRHTKLKLCSAQEKRRHKSQVCLIRSLTPITSVQKKKWARRRFQQLSLV